MRERSRVPWLRKGDRNTAYYHALAAQRKRVNRIAHLQRSDGSTCAIEDEDKAKVQSFYHDLYSSQGYNDMNELLQFVLARVTEDMNTSLDKPFEPDEVRVALFQMSPSKAPGVDGFTAGFFQRHWDLIKDDLVPAILGFLNGGDLSYGFNDTSITLIPKVRNLGISVIEVSLKP